MDAYGNPVHPEIIFIDADDEERLIWPKEFIIEENEGEFSATSQRFRPILQGLC